jgi:DNA-directed RNA polymerase beta' subunit
MRLGPMTDRELDRRGAVEIRKAELVDPRTLDPVAGGLFDQGLVGASKWGKISLPEAIPNPVFEKQIMKLLNLTGAQYRAILSGRMELPEHLR